MPSPHTINHAHLLSQALTRAGLDLSLDTARPIRLGENAIIGSLDLVARIVRPGQERAAR